MILKPNAGASHDYLPYYTARRTIRYGIVRKVLVDDGIRANQAMVPDVNALPDEGHRADVAVVTNRDFPALVGCDAPRQGPVYGFVRVDLDACADGAITPDCEPRRPIQNGERPYPRLGTDSHIADDNRAVVDACAFTETEKPRFLPSVYYPIAEWKRTIPLLPELSLALPVKSLQLRSEFGYISVSHETRLCGRAVELV